MKSEALSRHLYCFLEVDDVDPTLVLHEERFHFWVPFAGLVSVVNSSVDHFVNQFIDHFFIGCPSLIQDGSGRLGNPPRFRLSPSISRS